MEWEYMLELLSNPEEISEDESFKLCLHGFFF